MNRKLSKGNLIESNTFLVKHSKHSLTQSYRKVMTSLPWNQVYKNMWHKLIYRPRLHCTKKTPYALWKDLDERKLLNLVNPKVHFHGQRDRTPPYLDKCNLVLAFESVEQSGVWPFKWKQLFSTNFPDSLGFPYETIGITKNPGNKNMNSY